MTEGLASGFNGSPFSVRHRGYSDKLYISDIDILGYNSAGNPLFIIETKYFDDEHPVAYPNIGHPRYRVLRKLCNGYIRLSGGLPLYIVFYRPSDWNFVVYAMNSAALSILNSYDGVYDEEINGTEKRRYSLFPFPMDEKGYTSFETYTRRVVEEEMEIARKIENSLLK